MISRDSNNLCGKRKATDEEESNDENDMATAAKIMKPSDEDAIENDDDDSGGFDKSIESEFKTLKSLIPRIAGKAEIGEVSSHCGIHTLWSLDK